MIRAIAIDDEPFALKVLEEHCSKLDFLQLHKTFTNPLQGIEYVGVEGINTVFLDIKMHDISGVEIAELLPTHVNIIFTTAYPDYAIKGFEVNAVDYLLKPITFSRFLTACHRLKSRASSIAAEQVILIKETNEIARVKASEIYFIKSNGNYLKVHTSKGSLLHRQTLKDFLQLLPDTSFIQTHKSYIVNIGHISRIESFQLTVDNQKIPVSPNFKSEVWSKLGIG